MGQGFQGVDSSELSTNLKKLAEQPLTQQDGHRDGGHKMPIEVAAQKGREGLEFVIAEIGMQREEKVPQDPTQILHTAHDVLLPAAELVSVLDLLSCKQTIPQSWMTDSYKALWNLWYLFGLVIIFLALADNAQE